MRILEWIKDYIKFIREPLKEEESLPNLYGLEPYQEKKRLVTDLVRCKILFHDFGLKYQEGDMKDRNHIILFVYDSLNNRIHFMFDKDGKLLLAHF